MTATPHLSECVWVCVCACVTVTRTLQEPSPPRDDPGDAPVSTERSFQLGPAHKGPSLAVGVSQSKNKTMDELLAWEHIPSPLDKDQVNVSHQQPTHSHSQHTDTVTQCQCMCLLI